MPQTSYPSFPSFPNTLLGTVLNGTRVTHSKTTCRRDWIIRIFHQDWPLRLHLLGTFPLVWYSRHGSNILNFPDRLHTTSCQRCTKLKSVRKNILFRFKNKQKKLDFKWLWKMTHNETLIGETPWHQYPPKQKPDKTPKLLENLVPSDVSTFFSLTFLLPNIGPKRPLSKTAKHWVFPDIFPKGGLGEKKIDKGQGHPSLWENRTIHGNLRKPQRNEALLRDLRHWGLVSWGWWHWRPP